MKPWQTFLLCSLILGGTVAGSLAQSDVSALDLFERPIGPTRDGVRLRRQALESVKPGGALRLNLRPDATETAADSARVKGVSVTPLGSRVIRGRVDGQPDGSLLLVQRGGAVAGSISLSPTQHYALDGETAREIPAASAPLCACAADAPLSRRQAWGSANAAAPQMPRAAAVTALEEFDVLVVYTPAALKAESGSVDAVIAQADLAMADANACYQNSGIPIRGRIVGVRAVDYTESGQIRTDLHRLAVPDDGILDEVQSWRDEAQADFVCMFTRRDSVDGYKGYGEILIALTPDAEVLGFCVVDVQAATVEHLFAHELGHNMGCDHDRENTTGLRLFDFSYGWRFTGGDGKLYRDVMAYAPGVSVPYFASPAVAYAGTPTGVADYADTARTLMTSAPAFVNFRAADGRGRVSVSASVAGASVDDRGGNRATFAFERTGSVAQALDAVYEVGGTAVGGVNYKPLSGSVRFAAGSHFASVRVKPLAEGPPFGVETVEVALQPGDSYVAADSPTGGTTAASVTIYDRLPLVSLGAAVRRTGAAPGKLKFSVQRVGRLDGELTVHYRVGGTATAGVDYRAPKRGGAVTIPAGASNAAVVVHLLDGADQPSDGSRTVELALEPDAAYNVGAAGVAEYAF